MTKRELMAAVPLFRGCSGRELARISALAERVTAKANEDLVQEGTAADLFFVIERGEAEVTIGGNEVARLREGAFFGEIALLDSLPRTATVTARTPMVLYVVKAADFDRFLEDSPAALRSILRAVSERLRAAERAPSYQKKDF